MNTDEDVHLVPNKLYKFRALATEQDRRFTADILLKHQVYLASADSFNDPFDSVPNIVVRGDTGSRRDLFKRIALEQMPGEMRAARRRVQKALERMAPGELEAQLRASGTQTVRRVGICSLSARYDQVLMWSHYAANHTGICLRFDTEPPGPLTFAMKVNYQIERPVVDWSTPDENGQAILKAMLTKADFWRYEQEWRLLEPSAGPGAKSFPPARLDAVILGSRISADNRALVLSWLQQRRTPLELLQAEEAPDRFELRFRRVGYQEVRVPCT